MYEFNCKPNVNRNRKFSIDSKLFKTLENLRSRMIFETIRAQLLRALTDRDLGNAPLGIPQKAVK